MNAVDASGGNGPSEENAVSDLVEPVDSLPETRIEDLPGPLRDAAARAGWTRLMPVQAKTIPYLLAERDLIIQSRTGSGKTGAFLLPILEKIDPGRADCQALILAPTRELANQVAKEAEVLSGDTGARTVAVYGGVAYGPQIEGFKKGAHIVVGTPGRILDHLEQRCLHLNKLAVLIFDEADRMLSMGFYPDMKRLQGHLPRRRFAAYMFSATITPNVRRLANQFLRDPGFLSLSRDVVHVAEVQHVYYMVPAMEKDRCLVRVIEMENPDSALIFCNTRASAHYVATVLQRFGYDADEISSDLPQKAREDVMKRIRAGKLRFLVATDVAARGIDLVSLSHVFQYEAPEDPESYIHRAGRTGRAGAAGVAITLVAGMEQVELNRIAKRYGIDMERRPTPSDADVQSIVAERVTALLETKLRERDKLQTERMGRFVSLARGLGESADELRVIAMLLDDFYQETLHAPPTPIPDSPDAPSPASEKERSPARRTKRGAYPRPGRGRSGAERSRRRR